MVSINDSISFIVACILAVVLMIIFPIQNALEQQDKTSQIIVFTETARFVDAVRNTGRIEPELYQRFVKNLSKTGLAYTVEMEHLDHIVEPAYDDDGNFLDEYFYSYEGHYTDEIMDVLFTNDGSDDRSYYFGKGDYFTVNVINSNKTLATKVKEWVIQNPLSATKIFVRYGGQIKSEAY